MSSDKNYIICAYSNGKISLFRKGKDKLNKTKYLNSTKEILTQNIITEIKVYSNKKGRIIFYLIDNNGQIFRVKIYKGLIKYSLKPKNIVINSNYNYQYYNLQINPYTYKCFGICNCKGVFIYYVKKKENKLLYKKCQNLSINYYPNFCFLYSLNEKDKSKFIVSINPDSVILNEINSNYTNCIQLNKYMFKDPIIKIGEFTNEIIYIFDKENQITLINCNSESYKITQKCINNEDAKIFEKKNFEYKYLEDLSLYENIMSNNNKNVIINSNKKILLISPIALEETINKICNKNDKDKRSILFDLCKQVYRDKHPMWAKKDYEECSNLIIDKVNICITEALNDNSNDSNEKIEKLKIVFDFLFHNELYDYITSIKEGLYSKLNDEKIYFYLLEPYIIHNKMKSIALPSLFINKIVEFYKKENKKSWLCELLTHFDINLLCNNNTKNKNGFSLIDILDNNNLINIIIYFVLNNYEINKDYSYYSPVVNILLNLIKQTKNNQKEEIINKFYEIICNNDEYKEMQDYNSEKENIKENIDNNIIKNDFIELNRYNDELLFSNYYLRIKLFWYIYIILFRVGVNEENKKKCQELINKSFEAILNPEVYDIFEKNDNNTKILLNLDREFRFIINKIFKDETINEFCEIDKQDILYKIEILAKKKYISMIAYYLIYLRSYLDDSTLEINKETKLNILLFFMDKNNIKEDYKEVNDEKFEEDLLELIKKIDSFTFDDTDKIFKSCNLCKDNYPKLYEYIIKNFKC